MAAVNVVIPAAPPPAAVPAVRISRFALAAADTLVCLWIASLWVLLASFATTLIVSPWGWPLVGPACKTVLVSLLFVAVIWPLAVMLLSKFVEPFYTNQLKKGVAALEPLSKAFIGAHLIAAMAFGVLEVLGFLLKILAAKESPTGIIATVILAVAPVGITIMCCFVSIPGLAVRLWRARRHGSASVVPI